MKINYISKEEVETNNIEEIQKIIKETKIENFYVVIEEWHGKTKIGAFSNKKTAFAYCDEKNEINESRETKYYVDFYHFEGGIIKRYMSYLEEVKIPIKRKTELETDIKTLLDSYYSHPFNPNERKIKKENKNKKVLVLKTQYFSNTLEEATYCLEDIREELMIYEKYYSLFKIKKLFQNICIAYRKNLTPANLIYFNGEAFEGDVFFFKLKDNTVTLEDLNEDDIYFIKCNSFLSETSYLR